MVGYPASPDHPGPARMARLAPLQWIRNLSVVLWKDPQGKATCALDPPIIASLPEVEWDDPEPRAPDRIRRCFLLMYLVFRPEFVRFNLKGCFLLLFLSCTSQRARPRKRGAESITCRACHLCHLAANSPPQRPLKRRFLLFVAHPLSDLISLRMPLRARLMDPAMYLS